MFDTISHFALSSLFLLKEAIMGLVLPALFFLALGLLIKGRQLIQDAKKARIETVLNLKIIFFNVIFITPVIVVLTGFIQEFYQSYDLILMSQTFWANLPEWLIIFIAVFLGDFVAYWRHRLEHSIWLWPSHAVHHSDTEMTWLTLERFHPINRLTTFLIDSSILILFGFPPFAIIANNLIRHYYGFFIHADLPWTFGPVFGKIFISPAMHRWHHAADPNYFQANFATVFAIFDLAFGTYKLPGSCTAPLGVTDKLSPTLTSQFMHAFKPESYLKLLRHRNKKPIES